MKHDFHPDALAEYEAAAVYYAAQGPAVAERFIGVVESAIDRILDSPRRWRIIDEDVRRCLTRVFPFAILYTIEPGGVLIVAVMHCSRKPGYWKRRVAKP